MTPSLPVWEIRNAVLPEGTKAAIQIRGRTITGIGESAGCQDWLDANGLTVVPGLIDSHVHFRVPGGEHKEDWTTGCAAALAGGVTMVGDMPNTETPTTTYQRLNEKIRLIGQPPIDYALWFAGLPDNTPEISIALSQPQVAGVKVYFSLSTGGLIVREYKDRLRIFERMAESKKLIAVHAQDQDIIDQDIRSLRRPPMVSDHCFVQSAEAEISAVHQALRLQKNTGARILLCHLSCPGSIAVALKAKEEGRPVFIETCPHYLFLTSAYLNRPDGAFFKMNPALRSPEEVQQMLDHLCNGDIDIISTDHAPHTVEEKSAEKYEKTPSGVPGVQTLFPLLFSLVASGRLTIQQFIALTSTNAADLLGTSRKGRLEVGADADLVLYDPCQDVAFRNEEMLTKSAWSPFAIAGMHGMGVPKTVISRGVVRFRDGKVVS